MDSVSVELPRSKRAADINKRVTARFTSDSGREYLYDDITGSIFPWNDVKEAVLAQDLQGWQSGVREALEAQYGEQDVEAAYAFVRRYRDNYGAFQRSWNSEDTMPIPTLEALEHHVKTASFELLLILTENCNMRCQYCALSETYPLNRVRTGRKMSFDTARRAVDWYMALIAPQFERNPRKRFGLSFYGGEPMLNMPLMKQVLEYCRDTYPDSFLPVMTTNGTLLSPENVAVLVEHNVMLAISIDGPEEEHDRLRLDSLNRGTFAEIVQSLKWIKTNYPEYWATNITSVSVYDWGTDLEAVERFFDQQEEIIPRSVFVNQVGSNNTAWYSRYSAKDYERMSAALEKLRERYKQAKAEGKETSHYLNCITGMEIGMVVLRRRYGDHRSVLMPYSGSCVPGDKLAVHVDGKIDMCERVNGTYHIGYLNDEQNGIDYSRLQYVITEYQKQILSTCQYCSITKHCSLCFTHVEQDGTFRKNPEQCGQQAEQVVKRMADYISILEQNPDADFNFETDTSKLEERMLFKY